MSHLQEAVRLAVGGGQDMEPLTMSPTNQPHGPAGCPGPAGGESASCRSWTQPPLDTARWRLSATVTGGHVDSHSPGTARLRGPHRAGPKQPCAQCGCQSQWSTLASLRRSAGPACKPLALDRVPWPQSQGPATPRPGASLSTLNSGSGPGTTWGQPGVGRALVSVVFEE